jgi:hypothetical protein
MRSRTGYREADVVIAGGGTGGACAAIAAARNGADVLLVEQLGFLGGMFTGGNMCVSTVRSWIGVGKEIFDRLFEAGAAVMHPDDPPNYPIFHHRQNAPRTVPYDPEMAKLTLFQMCEEAGVKLLLHSLVTETVTDGNTIKGVTVENKSGRQLIVGKIICDATGDGDVAADAGAPFTKGHGPEERTFAMTMLVRLSHVDWPTVSEYSRKDPAWTRAIAAAVEGGELPYYKPRTREMISYYGHGRPELARLWHDDGALLWGGTVEEADGTDADSLTRAELECRKQWMSEVSFLRKHVPGFEKARVEDTGVQVGVRETRHILGEYTYTGDDFLEEREFPDTVAYSVPYALGVPYRCLVPKKINNLLLGCRCISVTTGQTVAGPSRGAYNHLKSMTSCMTYGQAAGTAAAICAESGVTPRSLDVKILQRALMEQGALVVPDYLRHLRHHGLKELDDLFSYSGTGLDSGKQN